MNNGLKAGNCSVGFVDTKGGGGGGGGETIELLFPFSCDIFNICFNPITAVEEDVCGCGDGDAIVTGMEEDRADGAAEGICADKDGSGENGAYGWPIGCTGDNGICCIG